MDQQRLVSACPCQGSKPGSSAVQALPVNLVGLSGILYPELRGTKKTLDVGLRQAERGQLLLQVLIGDAGLLRVQAPIIGHRLARAAIGVLGKLALRIDGVLGCQCPSVGNAAPGGLVIVADGISAERAEHAAAGEVAGQICAPLRLLLQQRIEACLHERIGVAGELRLQARNAVLVGAAGVAERAAVAGDIRQLLLAQRADARVDVDVTLQIVVVSGRGVGDVDAAGRWSSAGRCWLSRSLADGIGIALASM
jgi:hypothetical protein